MAERLPVLRRESVVGGGDEMKDPLNTIETVRNALAVLLVLAFVGMIVALLFKSVPGGNSDIITYMVGQLSGMALTALGFYFVNKVGQDALDAKRVDNTTKALEAITNTAQATNPDAQKAAEQAADETAKAAEQKADEFKGTTP